MTEKTGEARVGPAQPRPPIQDLFASAVHRFGAVWADLVVASAVALGLATIPVAAVHESGGSAAETFLIGLFAYAIAYFAVVGFIMLRGLPAPAPRRRVVWTYATAVMIGTVVALIVKLLGPPAIVPLPLFLFAVPAMAAGDVTPGGTIAYSALLALRNFSRSWLVWLITILFSAPVVVAMFLIVDAFASDAVSILTGLALAAPIVWPFSALFTRALYGDLTGRNVVAPEDRSM